ncbi:MAG: alpha/beta hydrolase [Gammaproteobacteria bacterium]|nr:alpha/beta hydrolase [Gammaproteobacteria bacterium]
MKHRLVNVNARVAALLVLMGWASASYADSNTDALKTLLGTALGCQLVEELLAEMPVEPLYESRENGCEPINPEAAGSTRAYFSDASCSVNVNYHATELLDFCQLAVDSSGLGNAQNIVENSWTHSPGSKLDLGARSLEGVVHPYMQRLSYKSVQTARGTCELEMRVYKSHPTADGRPLIALHGGSWSARGFGFFGLDLTVPHFVQQGFVVYAPFYRLLDNKEGTAACHMSDIGSITEDAESALAWVIENQSRFGSSGKPVVFGQSAGGHLAASLAVNRPEAIGAAVLMYPPTDFTDFVERAQQGFYTNAEGIAIVDDVLNQPVSDADVSASPIPENSFPLRVANDPSIYPPMMMVHGLSDELVEARQSIRLCDALAARALMPVSEEVTPLSSLREIVDCGATVSGISHSLHLLQQGKHALDICIDDGLLSSSTCPAGDADSRALVSDTLAQATAFASSAAEANDTTGESSDQGNGGDMDVGGSSGGSGGGVLFFLLGLLGLGAVYRFAQLRLQHGQ